MLLRSLLLILLSTLAACAQKPVTYDYDPAAAGLSMNTYALSEPASGPQYQSLDNNRIAAALRKGLAARNVKEVSRDQADVWVAYRVEQERNLEKSGVSFGFGFGTGNVGLGVGTGPKAKEVIEGRLVVDMVSPKSQQVVWTAKSNKSLRESMSPAERDALINELVTEMLANFPPASGQ